MKNILIIPDSFKGTLTAKQVCDIVLSKMVLYFKNTEIISIPIADGGEGSVDCLIEMLNGQKVQSYVRGPFENKVNATWGIIMGTTAVIEIASCAGHINEKNNNTPLDSTTYGVGELINQAINYGCTKIVVCLGGACTNDAGCGLAAAIGYQFLDKDGNSFVPTGRTLRKVVKIDKIRVNNLIRNIEFTTLVDVSNPLFGENGAAYVFAPQKGADFKTVIELDQGLRHISSIIKRDLGIDVSQIHGAGASGGAGAGMVAFLGSNLHSGIDYMIKVLNLEDKIRSSNLIITGEGKVDSQSLKGKAISGIGKCAKKYGIPVIVLTGGNDINNSLLYELGITSIFPINCLPEEMTYDYEKNKKKIENVIENICRLIQISVHHKWDIGDIK